MFTLRRADERRHLRRRKYEAWLTFDRQDPADPRSGGFGALELLNENRLPPGARIPLRTYHAAEIVTYVLDGALAYNDSSGRSGVIQAGEFQRVTSGCGVRPGHTNASPTDWAYVFQIGLRPSQAELAPATTRSAFPQERAAAIYASSPRRTDGEDRCTSTRTP